MHRIYCIIVLVFFDALCSKNVFNNEICCKYSITVYRPCHFIADNLQQRGGHKFCRSEWKIYVKPTFAAKELPGNYKHSVISLILSSFLLSLSISLHLFS